jgi:YggT family protein
VNELICTLAGPVKLLLVVYTFILLAYAVASWIPDIRGRWLDYVAMLVEPVLNPIRRIVPPIGGVDLAFLVLFVLLQLARAGLSNSCYV